MSNIKCALIKNNTCINVIMIRDVETMLIIKTELGSEVDDLVQLDVNSEFGIGDSYIDGVWSKTYPDFNLEDVKQFKINQSKMLLEQYLYNHPLLFIDGKYYTVTAEKQALLTSYLMTYQLDVQLGNVSSQLEWNSTGESCTFWTFEALARLALAIRDYVKPFVSYQRTIELQLASCSNAEELSSVVIDYESI